MKEHSTLKESNEFARIQADLEALQERLRKQRAEALDAAKELHELIGQIAKAMRGDKPLWIGEEALNARWFVFSSVPALSGFMDTEEKTKNHGEGKLPPHVLEELVRGVRVARRKHRNKVKNRLDLMPTEITKQFLARHPELVRSVSPLLCPSNRKAFWGVARFSPSSLRESV
jgi:hypothetical protein